MATRTILTLATLLAAGAALAMPGAMHQRGDASGAMPCAMEGGHNHAGKGMAGGMHGMRGGMHAMHGGMHRQAAGEAGHQHGAGCPMHADKAGAACTMPEAPAQN